MSSVSCPICGLPMPGNAVEWPHYPFCSQRCRTIDLGRWLSESYTVPDPNEDQSTPGEDEDRIS